MCNSNLYAVVLRASGFMCNHVNGVLKDAMDNSSMKMVDFLKSRMIMPLVHFNFESCCHLSILSTLFGVSVSDELNQQLAEYPCKVVGSSVSKSILSDDTLLIVCRSKKNSLDFLNEYVGSLVRDCKDLQSFFIKQVSNTLDPEVEKTSYKVALHCTLDTAQTIKDTIDSVLHGKGTYCPLQLLAMNFYGEDSFSSVENLVKDDVIHSYSVQNDVIVLNGYTIQNPYENQASDHTFFANLLEDTPCIESMQFIDKFYRD